MKFLFTTFILCFLLVSSVEATVFEDLIIFDGSVTTLEDNARSLIYDQQSVGDAGHGLLSSGDIIVSLVRFDRRKGPNGSPTLDDSKQLILLSSFSVENVVESPVNANLSFYSINYAPTSPNLGSGWSLREMIADSNEPTGLTDGEWTQATFALFEKSFASIDAANNPVSNTSDPGETLIERVAGDDSPATRYTLDILGGFRPSTADFFDNSVVSSPGGIEILGDMIASGNGTTFGTMSGGMSVFYQNLGDNLALSPIAVTSVTTGLSSVHDLTLTGGVLMGYDEENWDFSAKADYSISVAMPEPSSLVLCLMFAVCVASSRNRQHPS